MFGYVKTCKSELKVKEFELYSAAYCGLCRSMGSCTGQLSRLTLNYDFVFLYLIRSALSGEAPTLSYHRCIMHPIRKRPMIDTSAPLKYCARASVALSAFKLEDDINDSKKGKSLLYKIIFPFFKLFKNRADMPLLESSVTKKLVDLAKLEKAHCKSLDMPAQVFGELLGDVFSHGLEAHQKTLAYELGFHTGKFIYAADAVDDYIKDIKSGSYNPLVEIYGENFSTEQRESVKTAMLCELKHLEAAVNLVDFSSCRDIGEIVYNIIYMGMPEQMEKSLFPERNQNKK